MYSVHLYSRLHTCNPAYWPISSLSSRLNTWPPPPDPVTHGSANCFLNLGLCRDSRVILGGNPIFFFLLCGGRHHFEEGKEALDDKVIVQLFGHHRDVLLSFLRPSVRFLVWTHVLVSCVLSCLVSPHPLHSALLWTLAWSRKAKKGVFGFARGVTYSEYLSWHVANT